MKTISRIVLVCATLGIASVKADQPTYKEKMAAAASIVRHWQQRLNPAVVKLEFDTKRKMLGITKIKIHNRLERYERSVRLQKHTNPLFTQLPKWLDPELNQLAMQHRKLMRSINQMPEELELINDFFLPDAKRRYQRYKQMDRGIPDMYIAV
jgi:hypothetical protein